MFGTGTRGGEGGGGGEREKGKGKEGPQYVYVIGNQFPEEFFTKEVCSVNRCAMVGRTPHHNTLTQLYKWVLT